MMVSVSRPLLVNFLLVTLASAVSVLFGFFSFVNLLHIGFYYFYFPRTVSIVVFSPTLDLWVWMVSLLLVVAETVSMKAFCKLKFPTWTVLPLLLLLVSIGVYAINGTAAYLLATLSGFMIVGVGIYYCNGYLLAKRGEVALLTLGCIVGLLAVCELASTLSWVYNIFDYVVPFAPTLRWTFPLIDLNLFNLSYPLTPWLFIVFLYSWVWIPAAKIALSRISALKSLFPRFVGSGPPPAHSEPSGRRLKSKHLTLGLLLSAATAAFITIYPYIHLPSSTLVGADSVDYYKALTDMVREGPLTVLQNDRPAFNFLMYAFKYVTALSPEIVVKIIPILLSVCLGLSVFWFVRMGTKDERLAVVSSLFSSFSFQTIVGVYAAFYANWLALIESFVLLGLLLRSLEKSSWKLALVSTLVGVTILLTHPYTWDVLMVVLFFFLAWMFLKRKSEGNFGFGMLTFVLAANLMFYVAYSLSPFGKGVSQGAQLAVQGSSWSLSVQSVLNLENNLASTVQNYVGGLLANPLLIVLAVAGMFSISDFTKKFNRLMLLWIMVPSLALLAVSPDPFYIRLMYLIPIQILAAAGLCWILDRVDRFISRFDASKVSSMLKSLVIVLAVLLLLNYALRSVDGTLLQML